MVRDHVKIGDPCGEFLNVKDWIVISTDNSVRGRGETILEQLV